MAQCLINGTNNNSGNGIAIQILNFFVGKGFTPTQACGICGNVFAESSYIVTNKAGSTGAYGLFQWTDVGRRKSKFFEWCDANRRTRSDAAAQLDYCMVENERNFINYYKSNPNMSLTKATEWWMNEWERPSDKEKKDSWDKRINEANRLTGLFNQLGKTECNVDASSTSSDGSGNYTCSEPPALDTNVDVSASEQTTAEASDSSGESQTVNSVNTKPLFIGDSFALKVYNNSPRLKNAVRVLAKNGWTIDIIAKKLNEYTSNVNNKPKTIVVCCGYDTKFTDNVASFIYSSSAKDIVKKSLRKVLSGSRGSTVKFVESLYPIAAGCYSDYCYTACPVFNDAVLKIADEGDSAMFRLVRLSPSVIRELKKHIHCVVGKNEVTYSAAGFKAIGDNLVGVL